MNGVTLTKYKLVMLNLFSDLIFFLKFNNIFYLEKEAI